MPKSRVLLLYICLILAVGSNWACGASGDNYWPTWRGPRATGAALKGNPPVTWSETENIKWKIKLAGEGSSSPIVWEDRIFFLSAEATEKKVATNTPQPQELAPAGRGGRGGGGRRGDRMSQPPSAVHRFDLVCLYRKTGKLLWKKTVREELPHEGHQTNGSYASHSPVTDGKYVWAGFGSRGVYCYDMDGNQKWSRDLGKMRIVMSFGEGSSPALAGNALVVVMDHEGDSFIYALNKETGKTIWKKARDERTSWATPVAVEVDGKMQVIVGATNRVRNYDAATGNVVWECGGQTRNVIPSPVIGFSMVFCTSGFRGSALQAIELGRTGDLTESDAVKWEVKEATPYVPSPLLHGDKIYVCSVNKAVISCYEAKTGKPNFVKQSLEEMGEIYASPVGVADRVYFVGRDGVSQVIKHSEKFEVIATNTLDDKFDASPAIVGNELYLKGKKHLYCIAKQ